MQTVQDKEQVRAGQATFRVWFIRGVTHFPTAIPRQILAQKLLMARTLGFRAHNAR